MLLHRPWSAEDDKQLRDLRADKRSWMLIGARLRRSQTAVRSRVHQLKRLQQIEKPGHF